MNAHAQRWTNVCAALVIAPDYGEFARLESAYAQSHRAYHTFQHLSECLEKLDWSVSRGIFQNVACAEIALWYHDVVYQPRAGDNELKSAEWAHGFLTKSGVGDENCKCVHDLIMATRHEEAPQEPLAQLVVDIDLSILGAEPWRFDQYERQVREEYKWVPWFIYKRKREAILKRFLERPCIYITELFHAEYEQQARENLERSIARL